MNKTIARRRKRGPELGFPEGGFPEFPARVPEELSAGVVDWTSQWAIHGRNFFDGCVHLNVAGREIRLFPGPGFGDLSHPTTRLVLELMPRHVKGATVLDVGCGSGVLSLAAHALGAEKVLGIDIDPEAVEHARHNARQNEMQDIHFCLPQVLKLPPGKKIVVLMNMIRTEQESAWNALPQPFPFKTCITSGVMAEERSHYQKQTHRWGWKLQSEIEQEGWLGFEYGHCTC